MKQIIVTVGREHGSGGKYIAEQIAKQLGIAFYDKELLRKIKQVDKARARTREILSGSSWGQRDAYELIVNTSGWEIKELAPVVKGFAKSWFGRKQ